MSPAATRKCSASDVSLTDATPAAATALLTPSRPAGPGRNTMRADARPGTSHRVTLMSGAAQPRERTLDMSAVASMTSTQQAQATTASSVAAQTSPRFLSIEARSVISAARGAIASQQGIELPPRTAHSPRAVMRAFPLAGSGLDSSLHGRHAADARRAFTGTSAPHNAASASDMLDDDSGTGRDGELLNMQAVLRASSKHGVIAVMGSNTPRFLKSAASAREVGSSDAAIRPEVSATHMMFQRLAPRVLDLLDIVRLMRMRDQSTFLRSREGASASIVVPSAVGEVTSVQTGGGVHADAEVRMTALGPRLPPWALTCTTQGYVVLWNASTELPIAYQMLQEPDIASGLPASTVITCSTTLTNYGLAAVGSLQGCLHFVQLGTGTMLRNYSGEPSPGAGDAAHVGATGGITGFFTFPRTAEWNTVARGVSARTVPDAKLAQLHQYEAPTSLHVRSAPGAVGFSLSGVGAATRRASVGRRLSVAQSKPSSASEGVESIAIRGVVCIAATRMCDKIMVGYEGGFLRIFDTWQLQANTFECLREPTAEWRAHYSRFGVTSLQSVSVNASTELFLSAGGMDVKLWTVDGHFLSLFGQATPWPDRLLNAIVKRQGSGMGDVGDSSDTHVASRRNTMAAGAIAGLRKSIVQGVLGGGNRLGSIGSAATGVSPSVSSSIPNTGGAFCSAFTFGWLRAPVNAPIVGAATEGQVGGPVRRGSIVAPHRPPPHRTSTATK
ncbi:hypothetical protein EON66_00380 [archaeon]|nr:MAG: hypothetical protein EON66_00380 [archaeon]